MLSKHRICQVGRRTYQFVSSRRDTMKVIFEEIPGNGIPNRRL